MKKLFAGSMLLITTALPVMSAYAEDGFDGFYVNGKVGGKGAVIDWDSVNLAVIGADPDLHVDTLSVSDANGISVGILGNIGIGYAYTIKNLFLAGEASVSFASNQNHSILSNGEFTVIVEDTVTLVQEQLYAKASLQNTEFDLDFRPGWLFDENFLVYFRVGAAFTKATLQSSAIVDTTKRTEIAINKKQNIAGLRLGLGTEYLFENDIAIALDYVYTDYRTIDAYTNQTFLTYTNFSTEATADLKSHAIAIGLGYYF